MKSSVRAVSNTSFCLTFRSGNLDQLALEVYERVCRTRFDQPGFCVVDLGADLGSRPFRQLMVDLKQEMAAIH